MTARIADITCKKGRIPAVLAGFAICALMLVSAGEAAFAVSAARPSADALEKGHRICESAIRKAERKRLTPTNLLGALSLKETGRWSKERRASFSWPWTVMAEGRGRYLPSKAAAVREVRKLRARGISNIDVGCMQINLHYHPHAFANIEDALNPESNARYAAAFLYQLKEDHGNWREAVARYHSSDPSRNRVYRDAVYKLWHSRDTGILNTREVMRNGHGKRTMEERLAAYSRERAEMRRLAKKRRKAAEQKAADRRAAFERRKAQILAEWDEMKRQRKLRNRSGDDNS